MTPPVIMPIFDYKCQMCGNKFERAFKAVINQVKCPKCGEIAKRLYTGSPQIHFKGSGFYCTDYKGK